MWGPLKGFSREFVKCYQTQKSMGCGGTSSPVWFCEPSVTRGSRTMLMTFLRTSHNGCCCRSFYKKITSRVGLNEHWRNETYQKMPYILASINKENLRILSKKCPLCKSPIRRTPRVHLSRNFPEPQVTPSRALHLQYQNKTTPHLKKRGRNSVSNASAKFPKIFEYWFRYDLYHLFLVVLFFNLCEKRGYFIFLWFLFIYQRPRN